MTPELQDVPETMLWTLHNRASEARTQTWFVDDDALRIYDALDYDYVKSFGPAEPSHAVRSAVFDDAVRGFLQQHPDGIVVNLGEGLETQRYRLSEHEEALWISVDVEDAMKVREAFITPDEQHIHVPLSVLDRGWFDAVPEHRPVFITAQGLFMYLHEADVLALMQDMAGRFPGGQVMFDAIPEWLSRKTTSTAGWQKTQHYTTPPMPWGINRGDVVKKLSSWMPTADVKCMHWPAFPRGAGRWLFPVVARLPFVSRLAPSLVHVTFAAKKDGDADA